MNRIDIRGYKVIFRNETYDAISITLLNVMSNGDYFDIFAINSDGRMTALHGHASDFKFVRIIDD